MHAGATSLIALIHGDDPPWHARLICFRYTLNRLNSATLWLHDYLLFECYHLIPILIILKQKHPGLLCYPFGSSTPYFTLLPTPSFELIFDYGSNALSSPLWKGKSSIAGLRGIEELRYPSTQLFQSGGFAVGDLHAGKPAGLLNGATLLRR